MWLARGNILSLRQRVSRRYFGVGFVMQGHCCPIGLCVLRLSPSDAVRVLDPLKPGGSGKWVWYATVPPFLSCIFYMAGRLMCRLCRWALHTANRQSALAAIANNVTEHLMPRLVVYYYMLSVEYLNHIVLTED